MNNTRLKRIVSLVIGANKAAQERIISSYTVKEADGLFEIDLNASGGSYIINFPSDIFTKDEVERLIKFSIEYNPSD